MTALLARLLGAPRWLLIGGALVAALGTHAAAYRLGGAHEYRAGFEAGGAAMRDTLAASAGTRTSRQLKDRLHAETSSDSPADDGLRCGPSTRDCPR